MDRYTNTSQQKEKKKATLCRDGSQASQGGDSTSYTAYKSFLQLGFSDAEAYIVTQTCY